MNEMELNIANIMDLDQTAPSGAVCLDQTAPSGAV